MTIYTFYNILYISSTLEMHHRINLFNIVKLIYSIFRAKTCIISTLLFDIFYMVFGILNILKTLTTIIENQSCG